MGRERAQDDEGDEEFKEDQSLEGSKTVET